jgi:hypothetical protein
MICMEEAAMAWCLRGRFLALPLVTAALLPAACAGGPPDRPDEPATVSHRAGVVDWHRRVVSLPTPGWSVEFCEGEGPFLCAAREGSQAGSIELLRTSVRDHSAIVGVLGRGGSELEALQRAAEAFIAGLESDRRIGIAENYELRREIAVAEVMGKPGLHLVAEGRVSGRILERMVHYYSIHGDALYLLSATGLDGGGSLGEFAVEDLIVFEPVFREIAAASRADRTTR